MAAGTHITDWLWMGGLAVVPLALVAALGCRMARSPATRHQLWAAVMLSFLTSGLAVAGWRAARVHAGEAGAVALGAARALVVVGVAQVGVDDPSLPPAAEVPTRRLAPKPTGPGLEAIRVAQPLAAVAGAPQWPTESTLYPCVALADDGPTPVPSVADVLTGLMVGVLPLPEGGPTDRLLGVDAPRSTPRPRPEPAPLEVQEPALARSSGWSEAAAGLWGSVSAWAGQFRKLRGAILELSPLPWVVWLGGSALALLILGTRAARVVRVMKRGTAAPPAVRALVERAALRLGLDAAPETIMVGERVSPMVWCGVRPRLVLPAAYWSELDGASRSAVLVHELAHLRRKDHWLAWVQAVVGVLFWWHPVAWWTVSRVRDEAEAACDAWVTAVLPAGRRQYAEALLAAGSFARGPGVGPQIGVVSAGARQLARRITMVMTQKVQPRASMIGTAAALVLAIAGVVATPGWACPPEEGKQKAEAKEKSRHAPVKVTGVFKAPEGVKVHTGHAAPAAPRP
jgi:beta-lactamase regulating signal transducer with metallopeptidase domain